MTRLVVLIALAGCQSSATAAPEDPPREPPAPVALARPAIVRYHMRRHFGDLAIIQRQLITGYLDEARALAFALAKPESDPGLAPWAGEERALIDEARALAAATTVESALRRVSPIAAACARCHVQSKRPIFPAPPPRPRDRMELHQWGVDRLWEGMVGADDERWRAGLAVLETAAAPLGDRPDAKRLADALGARAHTARARHAVETIDERGVVYGELLVICAACHTRVAPR